ncbi:YkgJ family cysteine cluster protein [Pseudodesulfovibrio sp.]|uniref:YkgJ family cysteine cluster protein n=1 Tax=unclassified Pseudodesulfovibrio TaxID=2661612 RepID=UPI003AFFAF00
MQGTNSNAPKCTRCGACCIQGGPALHEQDRQLIEEGIIPLAAIVTLRPGERVYDQPAATILCLQEEMLKIKGRDNTWTCVFYNAEGHDCSIYGNRPAECDALFCQDIEPLAAMYGKDRLTRRDLLPEGHPLLELVTEHDANCAPASLEATAKRARDGDAEAGRTLQEIVRYDRELRRLTAEKGGMDPALNEFLFGRPLTVLLQAMNIKVYDMGESLRFDFALGEK